MHQESLHLSSTTKLESQVRLGYCSINTILILLVETVIVYILVYIYIGEGNGTPLQYSCLENPMDGGVWRAAVHGVAKSQTWLKRLSSSKAVWIFKNLFYQWQKWWNDTNGSQYSDKLLKKSISCIGIFDTNSNNVM